ncbi:MAG TPA: helix-turn-helix domain-containing protein [Candidatus Paceibacterota bacterium]|nr:helix-turn-helix domain-containing protein [Candidatus Paceibacterota bacterium]
MKPIKTTCPVTKTASLLSDTWTMLVVRALLDARGPMRFCELERALPGISTRTLALKLKKLESERIVRKYAAGTYAPTKKGEGLRVVERAMRRYGEKYL